MGPFILIDKSIIQGLTYEECIYLSKYYSHIISPILIRELTSMLVKQDQDDESLKKKVSLLAAKSHMPFTKLLPPAEKMAYCNLMGEFIPMDGRIPMEGGKPFITKDGDKVIKFDEPVESKMLRNWSQGIFQKSDIQKGKEFREIDSEFNLEQFRKQMSNNLLSLPKFKCLQELFDWIENTHFSQSPPEKILWHIADSILNPEHTNQMINRWISNGRPPIEKFAPYSSYFYKVMTFYILGIYSELIKGGKKAKTHLDIQYIYYLPFCMVFTSNDKELIKIASFFLKKNQEIISLKELKNDFNLFKNFFNRLSKKELKDFYLEYGIYPPELENCLTSEIWKNTMRLRPANAGAKPSPERQEKLLKMMKAIQEAKPI